jgi:endonuclease YncB( thermonuclease family)
MFQLALPVRFADGVALNREIVRQGWALAWYPDSGAVAGPAYAAEQIEAEQAQRGSWSGVSPWKWRATRPPTVFGARR